MKKYNSLKVLLTGVILAAGVLLASPTISEAKSFTDLEKNDSHFEAVNYLNNLNAYDYKTGNLLNGNSGVTRAEVSKVLYNLYKDTLKVTRTYNKNFADVSNSTLYSKEVIWSYEVGIFDGDSASKFEPTNKLTRAEMSKILVNTFNLKSKGASSFKDVNSKHWANSYVSILGSNGITNGDGKGNYLPENSVTLNQLSSFIYRVADEKHTVSPVVTKPTTPVVESKYKTIEDLKQIARDLYNDPAYYPEHVVVNTKTDLREEFVEYTFWSSDISMDLPGYAFYGRTVTIDVQERSNGDFQTRIYVANDREIEQEIDWKLRMDKAEKHIVDNYKLDTDYDVVLAINTFVGEQIDYGVFIEESNPFLVQRGNATTCTGYADVAAEMFKRFGIQSRLLTGDVHAWNVVLMDGKWYHTDPTFNDTTGTKTDYLLMTEAERAEDIFNIESTFKATDVKYDQSMAKAYSYADVKKAQVTKK